MRYFNLKNLGLLTVITFLINSCCNEHDENSGYIISDLDITNFQANMDYDCYNFIDTICIRDDSTYQKTFTLASQNSECSDLILPQVDFTKNSILIHKIMTRNAYFHRDVQIDSLNKIVMYVISESGCFCYDVCQRNSYNMVLVPKIESNYQIKFK